MPLTIPILVPERVIDWAVRKGYIEFEHGGSEPSQADEQVANAAGEETHGESEELAPGAGVQVATPSRSSMRTPLCV